MNMVIYEILLLEVICPIKTYITYFQTFNNKCYILVLIFSHYETIDLCSCATLLKFLSSNHWCDTQIKFLPGIHQDCYMLSTVTICSA